jgi:hypothetical protein
MAQREWGVKNYKGENAAKKGRPVASIHKLGAVRMNVVCENEACASRRWAITAIDS